MTISISLCVALLLYCQAICAGITPNLTQLDQSGPAEPNQTTEIDQILQKVEKQGDILKSFQSAMTYELTQQITNTKIARTGELWYQADEAAIQTKIHFADHQQYDLDEAPSERPNPAKYNEDYTFDGLWLTRRNERTKTIQKWEIAKKNWSRDSFRLGKGPFPLPFAIRRQDVLDHFEVKLIAPSATLEKLYPATLDTDHLQLTPKPSSSYAKEYHAMDIWISRKLAIPTHLSYSNKEYEITTVSWTKIELDKPIKPALFELDKPGSGWTQEAHPLEEEKPQ